MIVIFSRGDDFSTRDVEKILANMSQDVIIIEPMAAAERFSEISNDGIIFDIVGKKIDNEQFCDAAEECLDDGFPIDQKKDFFTFLWKRISLLMTYGLLIPIKSNL